MIEELKAKEKKINSEIRRLQETRKALRKLIRYEAGAAPQGGAAETKETEPKEPEKAAPKEPVKAKPSQPFEIPFEGHQFIYFAEAYTDTNGKEFPERGWQPVAKGNEYKLWKDCLIKVSDMEDLPFAKDGRSTFKVVEDCLEGDTKVKVVVHEERN